MLAPIDGWFTERFNTADLQEAKALLEELGVGITLACTTLRRYTRPKTVSPGVTNAEKRYSMCVLRAAESHACETLHVPPSHAGCARLPSLLCKRGFSHHYTAGVWMGNLQQRPMQDVTDSIGPALVLRALFAALHRDLDTQPLAHSPQLIPVTICRLTGQRASPQCPTRREWFVPGTVPEHICPLHQPGAVAGSVAVTTPAPLRLVRPTPGLQLAMDPRIPDALEVFPFAVPKAVQAVRVDWLVDGRVVGSTARHARQFLWPLVRGSHTVQARVWQEDRRDPVETLTVAFVVK